MILARYFDYFVVFSFIGWIYECTYCTVTNKKWSNRGFLYGPICPIYGTGAVLAMIIFTYVPSLSFESPAWKIFLICMVGSAFLEYPTSFFLEKKFHAVWWDYSNIPLNLNGRISLPTACGFGAAGILVVKFLLPFVNSLHVEQYPIITELLALIFMGILGADLALTVASLSALIERMDAMEEAFNQRLEAGVEIAQGGPVAIGSHIKNAALNSEPVEAAREFTNELTSSIKHTTVGISSTIKEKTEGVSNSMKERTDAFSLYVKEYVSKMDRHDRYHFSSIRKFKRNDKSSVSEKIKDAIEQFQKKKDKSINKDNAS
ncbi:MAG: putative ABC transporter permease [Butyrivibrio sp.]|nr:putative ABC transporter permease [Butyrivibrio sp.]